MIQNYKIVTLCGSTRFKELFLAVASSKRMYIILSVSISLSAMRHCKLHLIVFQNLIARQKTTYKKGFHFENLSPTKPLNFVRACLRSAESKHVSLCSRSIAALSNLTFGRVCLRSGLLKHVWQFSR